MFKGLNSKERTALLGKLYFQNFLYHSKNRVDKELPSGSFPVSLQEYLALGEECYKRDAANKSSNLLSESQIKANNNYYITEIQVMDDYAVILFDFIDPEGANAAYKDRQNLKIRVNKKGPNEGFNYTAHLIIDFNQSLDNKIFEAALEEVPGVSTGIIKKLFSSLNQHIQKFYKEKFLIDDPTGLYEHGQPKKYAVRPQISFEVELNKEFFELLRKPESLCSLRIINEENLDFDAPTGWKTEKEELYLSNPGEGSSFFREPKKGLQELCRVLFKKKFQTLEVKLKDKNGKPRTVSIDPEHFTLKTRRLIQTATLKFNKELSTGYQSIDEDVVKELLNALRRQYEKPIL